MPYMSFRDKDLPLLLLITEELYRFVQIKVG
jgi:hypothetical protein